MTYTFTDCFAKIKVDSYDSLPIPKIFSLHNVILHIKSVLNKDKKLLLVEHIFRKMLKISIS